MRKKHILHLLKSLHITGFFRLQHYSGFYTEDLNNILLHVFMQEFPVEVIPDGVINEALRSLGFTTGLILKNHIIIPPKPMNAYKKVHQNRTTLN
jgi:hypothetical protein